MSLVERCVHQIVPPCPSVLFRKEWERCKTCAYDLENNKKCVNYSAIVYEISEKKFEQIIPESASYEPLKLDVSNEKLELIMSEALKFDTAVLPVSQN
jgi:hypothetical protein